MSEQRSDLANAADRKREIRNTLLIYAAVIGVCVLFAQGLGGIPFVSQHLGTLIAAAFLYLPTALILRRGEDFGAYGLTMHGWGRGVLVFLATSVVVLPLYSIGVMSFFITVCAWMRSGIPLFASYRRICSHYSSLLPGRTLHWPGRMGERILAQLVVGISEEYFFRGYLQTRLNRAWPPRRRLFGASIGPSLPVVSVLFALGHLFVEFHPGRLAVFFPSLVFGWLRQATGSIVAGALFHATCNLFNAFLYTNLFAQ